MVIGFCAEPAHERLPVDETRVKRRKEKIGRGDRPVWSARHAKIGDADFVFAVGARAEPGTHSQTKQSDRASDSFVRGSDRYPDGRRRRHAAPVAVTRLDRA